MPRPTRVLRIALVACLTATGCTLDRAELHAAGGRIESEIDDLSVLTYRDDPATDDWTDLVVPDAAVVDEGDAFREDDSRTAAQDEPADLRRLFTRVGEGRTVLVQLDRASGGLRVWEFVDGSDGPLRAVGALREGTDEVEPTEVESGDFVTVVREAGAGDAEVVVSGDDDVSIELVATHTPDDGVDLHVDVYVVTGAGRATVAYDDARGSTAYELVVG